MTITPETIAGILIAVGTFGAVIYKMGWVVFGKTPEPALPERRSCPETVLNELRQHHCVIHPVVMENIANLASSVKSHEIGSARREEKIDNLAETMMEVSRSVSAIEGFLQGRNGFHK